MIMSCSAEELAHELADQLSQVENQAELKAVQSCTKARLLSIILFDEVDTHQ